jgi:hypothetical protein
MTGMRKHHRTLAGAIVAIACLALAVPASADLKSQFGKLQNCPWKSASVKSCVYALVEGGEVRLGTRTVPIENPVVIQAGTGLPQGQGGDARLFAPDDGTLMENVPQNVPGGLLNIGSTRSASPVIRVLTAAFLESGILGLSATMELAGQPSDVSLSQLNLSLGRDVAVRLPVKLHLESPLLGPECYVGSAEEPMLWKLMTGTTKPPPPNRPISGRFGTGSFIAEGLILQVVNDKLVDNAWAAPRAHGCGGPLSFWIDPMVNAQLRQAGAGHNTAILRSGLEIASAPALKYVEEGEL